jgi:hypothetical protein
MTTRREIDVEPGWLPGVLRSFWLGALVLLVLQARTLGAAWRGWDLPLWDWPIYYDGARRVVRSLSVPHLDWAPLYSVYLAPFNLVFGDDNPLGEYVAQRIVVQLGLAVVMLWMLRRIVHPLIALILSAWFASMVCVATDGYVAHTFALLPIVAALGLSTCKDSLRMIGVPVAVILAALVRLEFVLGLVVVVAWLVRETLLRPRERRALAVTIAIVVASIVVLGRESVAGGRSWLAFVHHYAWGFGERHPEWAKDHWVAWREPIGAAFGDATSVAGALRANPGAVATHLLHNARLFPSELVEAMRPTWLGVWPARFASGALLALPVLAWIRYRRLDGERKASLRADAFAKARDMLPAALACGIPVAALLLAIRPLDKYLIILVPLILLAVGLALQVLVVRPPKRAWATDLVLCATAAALLLAPVTAAVATPSVSIAADALERTLRPGRAYRLLALSAAAFCGPYLRRISCSPVELTQIDWNKGAAAVAEQAGVDVVLVDATYLPWLPPRLSGDVRALQQAGWNRISTAGSFTIYLRPSIW